MRVLPAILLLLLSMPALGEEADGDPLTAARALLHTERHDEGVAALREIIATNRAAEPDAERLVLVGQSHWLLDEYGNAWYRLARLLGRAKENETALEAILKALEHGEDHANAQFQAGLLLCRAGRDEEGVKHYRKAIELDPENANAHYNLGGAFFRTGQHAEALASWEAAAALDPTDILAHANVMRALTALGRHEEAVTWREKVYAIYDASEDPRLKGMRSVLIDEFEVDGATVLVREVLRRGKLQLYTTIFYVSGENDLKFRINLEPHGAAFLGGPKFILGRNEGPKHTTYDRDWKERPSYPELRKAVIQAIQGELAARSSSNAETGKVRLHPD